MERDLLSRVTGDGVQRRPRQGQDPVPPPSPTLSLRLGSAEERLGRRADATVHAPAPAPSMLAPLPTTSRTPFASDRLAASVVVVPGYPVAERRHNLRAGAGQTCAPRTSPAGHAQRPPAPATVPILQLAGPPLPAAAGQERCEACGLSAQLLQGLSSELDRARAQVALLTCQNESLRSRLKRAAAAAAAEPGPAASSARLDLRCGACRVRPATVALAPRDHLCLCARCSDDAAAACSVCRGGAGTGTGPAEALPRPPPASSSWPSRFLRRS